MCLLLVVGFASATRVLAAGDVGIGRARGLRHRVVDKPMTERWIPVRKMLV
jgi:hypothetical protein